MRLSLVPDLLAVGAPPPNPDVPSSVEPMGVLESYLLLGALIVVFWVAFRLVVFLDIKVRSHKLLREIELDLGIGEARSTISKWRLF